MKKIVNIIMTLTICFSFVSCGNSNKELNPSQNDKKPGMTSKVEIPNPFIECNTLSEASNITGFDIEIPNIVLNDVKETNIRVMNKEMIEVVYSNDSEKICIRKAMGNEDISGNYNSFEESYEIPVNDLTVTFKGNGGKVNIATWINGEYAFSVDSMKGLTKEDMINMISNIK